MDDYERIHLVKQEVFVYRIQPVQNNRGQRAADWKLDSPDWTGRLRLVSRNKNLVLKLEDRVTGELFAKAPIDKYPGVALESVLDSSRYFVLRLQHDNGQNAFVGIGFADRSDSFDLNVSLQDFFKDLKRDADQAKAFDESKGKETPSLNLGFKSGQTITLNIGKKEASTKPTSARSRASAGAPGCVPFLPPPPSSGSRVVLPPPGSSRRSKHKPNANSDDSDDDEHGSLSAFSDAATSSAPAVNNFTSSNQFNTPTTTNLL